MQRRKFHLWLSIFCALSLMIYGCDNQKSGDKKSSVQTEGGQESKPQKKQIWLSILGGAVGGTFSPFAGGIGTVVSKAEPNIRISVEGSAGSIENVRRVNSGGGLYGGCVCLRCLSWVSWGRGICQRGKERKYPSVDSALHRLQSICHLGK